MIQYLLVLVLVLLAGCGGSYVEQEIGGCLLSGDYALVKLPVSGCPYTTLQGPDHRVKVENLPCEESPVFVEQMKPDLGCTTGCVYQPDGNLAGWSSLADCTTDCPPRGGLPGYTCQWGAYVRPLGELQ